ncbi:Lrp/AsnC family transcriptional regulator [Embleya sp. NPDC050154]|uniref:Lrp/AsnC family transcriptional regulator n=1 Tax=unclassified Embleya TaxID=2699296 RepID=UPI00378C6416
MRPDGLDKQIVAHHVRDARASFAGIGAEVGLWAPAVERRVDRLREAGVIRGFHAGWIRTRWAGPPRRSCGSPARRAPLPRSCSPVCAGIPR